MLNLSSALFRAAQAFLAMKAIRPRMILFQSGYCPMEWSTIDSFHEIRRLGAEGTPVQFGADAVGRFFGMRLPA